MLMYRSCVCLFTRFLSKSGNLLILCCPFKPVFVLLEALVEMLLTIAELEPPVCDMAHLKAFLTAYHATMASTGIKSLSLAF